MVMQCDPSQRTCRLPEQTEPGLTPVTHSSTAPLRRYFGFQRAILCLVLKTSLIISLEWMMMIINNQVCECLGVSVVCGAAKYTERKAAQGSYENDREGSVEDLSQKSREVLQQMRCAWTDCAIN